MAQKLEDDDLEFDHAINVTPFIDVALVLLIIFMVAAPLATSDIAVNLPASSQAAKPRQDKPIYLTIKDSQEVYIGNEETLLANLPQELARLTDDKSKARIFIRADKAVDYGNVVELLDLLRQNGYLKVGLVGLAQE